MLAVLPLVRNTRALGCASTSFVDSFFVLLLHFLYSEVGTLFAEFYRTMETKRVTVESIGTATTAPMLFCSKCSNLLYPECDDDDTITWRCNYCKTTEQHDDCKLVHVMNLKMKADAIGGMDLIAEFASDPTAQRDPDKPCPRCGKKGVACFVNPLGQPQEDMTLYFACSDTECRYVWKGAAVEDQN